MENIDLFDEMLREATDHYKRVRLIEELRARVQESLPGAESKTAAMKLFFTDERLALCMALMDASKRCIHLAHDPFAELNYYFDHRGFRSHAASENDVKRDVSIEEATRAMCAFCELKPKETPLQFLFAAIEDIISRAPECL